MGLKNLKYGLGWRKQNPDPRDYQLVSLVGIEAQLPESVDLRSYMTSVKNQGQYGSCTAHAAAAIYEWLERRKSGKITDFSEAFNYWFSRKIEGVTGDEGSTCRAAIKAMGQYGNVYDSDWKYTKSHILSTAPTQRIQSMATKHEATQYFSIPPTIINLKTTLQTLPVQIGFTCYDSIMDVGSNGLVPLPRRSEQPAGGHSVALAGYNKQGFLFKNSWSTDWGMEGYGILPTEYITWKLADDIWTVANTNDLKKLAENHALNYGFLR